MARRQRFNATLVLAFAVFTSGLLVAAVLGLPLAWDSSAYLYQLLASGSPFTPHGRLIDVPLQAPALLVAKADPGPDLTGARLAFALAYAAVPAIAILSCWWILHGRNTALLLWPALGIGMTLLPGLANFGSEAMIAVELSWPILCAATIGIRRREAPLVAVLAVAVALSHPFGPALLCVAAMIAWANARVGREFPPLLAVMALMSATWFVMNLNSYQVAAARPIALRRSFDVAVAGAPLIALMFLYASAALMHACRTRLGDRARVARSLAWLAGGGIAAAAAFLVIWSIDSATWRNASEYRTWAIFTSVPLFAFLWLERRRDPPREGRVRKSREAAILAAAVCAASVITLQSIGWNELTTRLQTVMDERRPSACIDSESVPWVRLVATRHLGPRPALASDAATRFGFSGDRGRLLRRRRLRADLPGRIASAQCPPAMGYVRESQRPAIAHGHRAALARRAGSPWRGHAVPARRAARVRRDRGRSGRHPPGSRQHRRRAP